MADFANPFHIYLVISSPKNTLVSVPLRPALPSPSLPSPGSLPALPAFLQPSPFVCYVQLC